MEIKKQFITPTLAVKMLEKNTSKNRRVNKERVSRYAQDMKQYKWKDDTGEVIKISKQGTLLDGQHRLEAIIAANVNLFMWVAYDLDESVFDVIDTGKSRSASDVFRISGIKNDSAIASIIQSYGLLKLSMNKNVQINTRKTNADLLEVYNAEPEFWQFVFKKSSAWYDSFSKVINTTLIGTMFATFYKINPEQAEDFMNQLCKGLNVNNKSIEVLRKKLIEDRLSNKKMNSTMKNILIVKVWNYYRKKEGVKVLKFDYNNEEYPRPI